MTKKLYKKQKVSMSRFKPTVGDVYQTGEIVGTNWFLPRNAMILITDVSITTPIQVRYIQIYEREEWGTRQEHRSTSLNHFRTTTEMNMYYVGR